MSEREALIARVREVAGRLGAQTLIKSEFKRQTGISEDRIYFRGLVHAPVNEQGVVFPFGVVVHELDYVVEMVTTGFPDCEAKRRIGDGHWERVRVEFEFQSRNFPDHGHDPAGCDVVVRWEHNWRQCPNGYTNASQTFSPPGNTQGYGDTGQMILGAIAIRSLSGDTDAHAVWMKGAIVNGGRTNFIQQGGVGGYGGHPFAASAFAFCPLDQVA